MVVYIILIALKRKGAKYSLLGGGRSGEQGAFGTKKDVQNAIKHIKKKNPQLAKKYKFSYRKLRSR